MSAAKYRHKCRALQAKCDQLEAKLVEYECEAREWRHKYVALKTSVTEQTKQTVSRRLAACVRCGEQYELADGYAQHFMRRCPVVLSACQQLLNKYLHQQRAHPILSLTSAAQEQHSLSDHSLDESMDESVVETVVKTVVETVGHNCSDPAFTEMGGKSYMEYKTNGVIGVKDDIPEVCLEFNVDSDLVDAFRREAIYSKTISIGF